MKKHIIISGAILLSSLMKAQTVAVQFYIDANNNCTYNAGEQLLYNVNANLTYITSSLVPQTAYTGTATSCSSGVIFYLNNPLTPPQNTLYISNAPGIQANLTCGNYNNLTYNTNNIQYLPVTVSNATTNVGNTLNYCSYYSSLGTYTYANNLSTVPLGICSNFGSDSIYISFTQYDYYNCTAGNLSPRTFSLYFDGLNYDVLTTTGGYGYQTASGANSGSKVSEFYYSQQDNIYFTPKFPSTFTALGTHTFAIVSSPLYANAASSNISFSCLVTSVPCSKISGKFYSDCNQNCVFDSGDSYGVGANATGHVFNSLGTNITFYPAFNGDFALYLPSANAYSMTQISTNPSYTACNTSTITIPAASTNTYMFGYKTSPSSYNNPGIYIHRSNGPLNSSPGVGIEYGIYVTNQFISLCTSTQTNPGKLKFVLPKFFSYMGALTGPTPTFVSGTSQDTLVWNISNFSAISNTLWINYFATFSLAISPTVTMGTPFTLQGIISPLYDNSLSNNVSTQIRYCGGPFDPNNKETEAAGIYSNGDVPYSTKQFYYTINFQNVGTAPAVNVKTVDTLDVNFDLSTLEVVQSSYPVRTQIDNSSRQVIFNFDGINLPDASSNEPKSHGFVKYGIKYKNGTPVNTVLKNRGHNFFDFNAAVPTNQTANKLIVVTGIDSNTGGLANVKAIPNPFSEKLTISSEKKITRLRVYSLVGELVKETQGTSNDVELSFENLPSAIYIILVESADGNASSLKVVKQ